MRVYIRSCWPGAGVAGGAAACGGYPKCPGCPGFPGNGIRGGMRTGGRACHDPGGAVTAGADGVHCSGGAAKDAEGIKLSSRDELLERVRPMTAALAERMMGEAAEVATSEQVWAWALQLSLQRRTSQMTSQLLHLAHRKTERYTRTWLEELKATTTRQTVSRDTATCT